MPDPFANLPALVQTGPDAAELFDMAGGAGLSQPWDDVPDFAAEESEVDTHAALADDLATIRRPAGRAFADFRADPAAYRHLAKLPAEGESLHAVISGRYAMWDLVPAIMERTGEDVDELQIATLSYSRANAAELLALVDAGRIRRVVLLVSYFFKAQNRHLYDALVPELLRRGHEVLAMRTHAKILLVRTTTGACYVCEGSANLRSCKNVEQFVLSRCAALHAFHAGWMESELLAPRRKGVDGAE